MFGCKKRFESPELSPHAMSAARKKRAWKGSFWLSFYGVSPYLSMILTLFIPVYFFLQWRSLSLFNLLTELATYSGLKLQE
jgi:hypothetical protein